MNFFSEHIEGLGCTHPVPEGETCSFCPQPGETAKLREFASLVAATVDAETLVKQWIASLQDESRVTDEDAEDLMFRIIAYANRGSAAVGEQDRLVAMFTELSDCYTASMCAAQDREERLRLKGMSEAYYDAALRCREWPEIRRNDGTLVTATPKSTEDSA